MNILSDYLVKSIIAEKHREAARLAEVQQAKRLTKAKRQTETKTEQPEKHFWQLLRDFAAHIRRSQQPPNEVLHSEEDLYHAEMFDVSTEELRRLSEKRRLYERIAQGNALIEAEYQASKVWEGR